MRKFQEPIEKNSFVPSILSLVKYLFSAKAPSQRRMLILVFPIICRIHFHLGSILSKHYYIRT